MPPVSLTPAQLAALGINLVLERQCSTKRIRHALKKMQTSDTSSINQLRQNLFGSEADELAFPLGSAQQASLSPHNKVFDQTLCEEWSKQLTKLLIWRSISSDISGDEIKQMFQAMKAPNSPIGNLARTKREGF